MRKAADLFAKHNKFLTIEALCPESKPNYLYHSQYETLVLMEEIAQDNVFIQLDIYHAQMVDGNLSYLIKNYAGKYAHVQVSAAPSRHEPDEGEILVRYKNQTYSIKETRTLFSLVNQDNILFSGSVRDNIYLLSEERNEDKIIEALKIANIYDELMEKKNKLDTKLIERGGGLSLGQIQRVALAISILNNKKIPPYFLIV